MCVVALLTLAACHGGKPALEPVSNSGGGGGDAPLALASGFRDGALWSCQIGGYDPQPCKLSRDGDHWRLTKLLGSQRFTGQLVELGGTLRFSGRFFCPWGDCAQDMEVEFQPDGAGYATRFGEDDIRLRHDDAVEADYGGAGYGGLTGDEQ